MLHQLMHVLGTYLHRKLFWFVALLYLLLLFADWTMPVRQTPRLWQQTQVRWLPEKTFDGVTAFVDWAATDQELMDLKSLTIDGSFLVDSDRLRDDGQPLQRLELDSDVTPPFLKKLDRCVHLQELHLRSFELTPELGESIAQLPNLHQLELTLIGSPIATMANLPVLNQLHFFQVPQVPLSELGLLSKHPQLTTVVLQDWQSPVNQDDTPIELAPCTLDQAEQIEQVILKPINLQTWNMMHGKGLAGLTSDELNAAVPFHPSLVESLVKLPNLRAVEIRDPWGGWPARTIDSPQLEQALGNRSGVSINPMLQNADGFTNPFSYFATFAIFVVILMQLFEQFGSPLSRTVHGFTQAHLLVAGALLTVQLLIASMIQVSRLQLAWSPALALAMAIPAIVSLVVGWVTRFPRILPFVFPIGIWGVVGFAFAKGVALNVLGGDEFLQAANPVMLCKAWVTVALELSLIYWAASGVRQLAVQLEEANLPTGLGVMQTIKQLQLQKIERSKADRPERRPAWRLLDHKLTAFLLIPPRLDQASYRRQQWQAANIQHWTGALIACLIGPWVLVGIGCVTFGSLTRNPIGLSSYAFYSILAGTFSWAMYSFMLGSYQLMRRPVIEQESVRPIWRSELNQRLLETPWTTSWPAMVATIMYLISLAVFSKVHLPDDKISESIAELLIPHALLTLTWPLPILAASTMLLTIISEFWRGVLAFAIHFSLFVTVQIFVISRLFANSAASSLLITSIYAVIAGCVLVALLLVWQSRKRLSQMQWGLVTS